MHKVTLIEQGKKLTMITHYFLSHDFAWILCVFFPPHVININGKSVNLSLNRICAMLFRSRGIPWSRWIARQSQKNCRNLKICHPHLERDTFLWPLCHNFDPSMQDDCKDTSTCPETNMEKLYMTPTCSQEHTLPQAMPFEGELARTHNCLTQRHTYTFIHISLF